MFVSFNHVSPQISIFNVRKVACEFIKVGFLLGNVSCLSSIIPNRVSEIYNVLILENTKNIKHHASFLSKTAKDFLVPGFMVRIYYLMNYKLMALDNTDNLKLFCK